MKLFQERLFPTRSNSRFYALTQLRIELCKVAEKLQALRRRNLTLIDLGSGTAPYRSIFKPHVENYISVDLSSNKIADVHLTPGGGVPLPDDVAHLVLSTQALEHAEDPVFYLSECNRLLRTDGLLILSTHGYWPYHPSPNDYWRWTSQGLKKVVADAGFEVLEYTGIMGLAATSIQLLQDALMPGVPLPLRSFFSYFMQLAVAICDTDDSFQKAGDACIYLVTARKRKTLQ